MKTTKPIITLCSSATFYKKVLEVSDDLKKLGFRVKYPLVADIMRKTGNYNDLDYRTWLKDSKTYDRKTFLMLKHFDKVAASDAILVVNLEKNGQSGYIGPNGLMEMGLALWLKKPIYLLYPPAPNSPLAEEINGMNAVVLDGDLKNLTLKKKPQVRRA